MSFCLVVWDHVDGRSVVFLVWDHHVDVLYCPRRFRREAHTHSNSRRENSIEAVNAF